MVQYCKRQNCGHAFEDHRGLGGRCLLTVPGAVGMVSCSCAEFMAEEPLPEPPLGMPALPVDILEMCAYPGCESSHDFQHRFCAEHRKLPGASLPPINTQLHLTPDNLTDVGRELHGDPGAGVTSRVVVDPPMVGFQVFVAGRYREATELSATANAIVAETNCTDLAEGAAKMRATIRTLEANCRRLQSQIESSPLITINVDAAKPFTVGDVVQKLSAAIVQEMIRLNGQ